MRFLKLTLLGIGALALIQCGPREAGPDIVTFRIANETDHRVSLLFYNVGASGQRTLASRKESDGKGVLWEKKYTVGLQDFVPDNIFDVDLIVIIFNGERAEEHTVYDPEHSMFKRSLNFSGGGNNLVYNITTEKNFDNAIPCDGPCE